MLIGYYFWLTLVISVGKNITNIIPYVFNQTWADQHDGCHTWLACRLLYLARMTGIGLLYLAGLNKMAATISS